MDDDRILAAITRNVQAVAPHVDAAAISPDRSLADLGCSSIDRAEIVTMVMEDLAITVPVHEFREGDPIGTLVQVFRRHA